jgi:hypothetical protein
MQPEEGASQELPVFKEAEAKSREGLQEVLDMLERLEAFAPEEGNAIMCKQCGMPCYDDERSPFRRAFPTAGDGAICSECMFG